MQAGFLAPRSAAVAHGDAVRRGWELVAARTQQVAYTAERVPEELVRRRGFEVSHNALAEARRLVRLLYAVVAPQRRTDVQVLDSDKFGALCQRCRVAPQLGLV